MVFIAFLNVQALLSVVGLKCNTNTSKDEQEEL